MPPSSGNQANKALLVDDGGYNPLVRSYLPGGGWQRGVVLLHSHDFNISDDVFQTNKYTSHRKTKIPTTFLYLKPLPKSCFQHFYPTFPLQYVIQSTKKTHETNVHFNLWKPTKNTNKNHQVKRR